VKILLVDGIGHSDSDPNYYATWKQAVSTGLQTAGFQGAPDPANRRANQGAERGGARP